jgi:hypothetical protein
LLVCVGLSGCTNNSLDAERNKFVGNWNTESGIPAKNVSCVFFSNGSGSIGNFSITWILKDGNLSIESNGETHSYAYSFSNNDKILTLTNLNGGQVIFTRQ